MAARAIKTVQILTYNFYKKYDDDSPIRSRALLRVGTLRCCSYAQTREFANEISGPRFYSAVTHRPNRVYVLFSLKFAVEYNTRVYMPSSVLRAWYFSTVAASATIKFDTNSNRFRYTYTI